MKPLLNITAVLDKDVPKIQTQQQIGNNVLQIDGLEVQLAVNLHFHINQHRKDTRYVAGKKRQPLARNSKKALGGLT